MGYTHRKIELNALEVSDIISELGRAIGILEGALITDAFSKAQRSIVELSRAKLTHLAEMLISKWEDEPSALFLVHNQKNMGEKTDGQ